MQDYLVKDLMVPLSEYATVPEGSTLYEAVQALEKAQEEFDHTKYVSDLRKKQRLKAAPLKDLCRKSYELKVEDFMQTTAEGECIDHEATLDIAIHTLVLGNHLSLMVTKDKQIIGVLRLSDVFAAVFHSMKECSV
jgi:CBS domain containing-hemolysin-like protein